MTPGLESLGLGAWIFVIIILIICCSAIGMCCAKNEEDNYRATSRSRALQKPYDPRTDGVVDLGPSLYSNHSYNSTLYDNDYTTSDYTNGLTDIGGDTGNYDGDCGNTGGDNGDCGGGDGGGDCGGGGGDDGGGGGGDCCCD